MDTRQPASEENRFEALLRAAATILWWGDAAGAVTQRQPSWEDYTGQDRDAYGGIGWLSAFHPDDRAAIESAWRAALAGGPAVAARGRLLCAVAGAHRAVQVRFLAVRGAAGGLVEWQAAATDIDDALAAAEDRARRQVGEVNHRVKNLLSVVVTIARQTSAQHPDDFLDRFEQRLRSLSVDQDLLTRGEGAGVDLGDLVRAHLQAFPAAAGNRVTVSGPAVALTSAMAVQSLGMAVHELAANAVLHGALSVPGGSATLAWECPAAPDGKPRLSMAWRESGGPPVEPLPRKGFGTMVLTSMLQYGLGAEVALSYRPEGLAWTLRCPLGRVTRPTPR